MGSDKHKKDLENFFKGGAKVPDHLKHLKEKLEASDPVDEARVAALQALRDAEDFRAFVAAFREFRKAGHAMPDDEELLIRMLDLPDERSLQVVLEHIISVHRRRGFDRTTPLKNRMSTIRAIAEDPKTETLLSKIAEFV